MSHVEVLAETSQCRCNLKIMRFFGLCPQNDKSYNVTNLLTYSPINLFTKRSVAFTLAEVLITLGVIGVVAAFTIPTIAKNYYKHTVEVQLAATYAELSEAIKKSELENGPILYWDYNYHSFPSWRSDYFAEKYIMPYLDKKYKTCYNKSKDGCYKDGYPIGASYAYKYGPSGKIISFSTYTRDGACNSFPGTCTVPRHTNIIVDVDGNRGPSKAGIDVHYFIVGSYKRISPWGYTNINGLLSGLNWWSYYVSASFSDDEIKSFCGNSQLEDSDVANMVDACTVWVHRNGWKFPKDYPIKF